MEAHDFPDLNQVAWEECRLSFRDACDKHSIGFCGTFGFERIHNGVSISIPAKNKAEGTRAFRSLLRMILK